MFRPFLAIFKGAILEGTNGKAFAMVIVICPQPVLTSPGNVKAFVPFGMYKLFPWKWPGLAETCRYKY